MVSASNARTLAVSLICQALFRSVSAERNDDALFKYAKNGRQSSTALRPPQSKMLHVR